MGHLLCVCVCMCVCMCVCVCDKQSTLNPAEEDHLPLGSVFGGRRGLLGFGGREGGREGVSEGGGWGLGGMAGGAAGVETCVCSPDEELRISSRSLGRGAGKERWWDVRGRGRYEDRK